jgi:hypothetical protein
MKEKDTRNGRILPYKYTEIVKTDKARIMEQAADLSNVEYVITKMAGQRYKSVKRLPKVPPDHLRVQIRAKTMDDLQPFWLKYYELEYNSKNPDLK